MRSLNVAVKHELIGCSYALLMCVCSLNGNHECVIASSPATRSVTLWPAVVQKFSN